MYKATDGKKFGNHEQGKRYDSSRPKAAPAEHAEPDGDEHSIEDVVAKHGHADHVEVHSHHGGHVHKMTHHDAESAHHHVDQAFGHGDDAAMEHPEPAGDASEMGGMSGGIPTMAGS